MDWLSYCVAASSRLAELASQLTPAQAQTIDHLLHSVKQFSPHVPTTLHSAQVLAKKTQSVFRTLRCKITSLLSKASASW